MDFQSNKVKTMLCVSIAGFIFILAVLLNIPPLILLGAVFDWLPLPTGWMKFENEVNKKLLILHVILTVSAYLFAVAWLITGAWPLSLLFMELWWAAVMAGVFMSF